MTPAIAQRGSGVGPLVLAFHVGAAGLVRALAAAGLGDATVATVVAPSYAPLPPWQTLLQEVAERARWGGGAVVLVGWSAGAGAVRELLARGARPEVTIALDGGVGGAMPPDPDVVRVWREAADRARRGDGMLVLSHTYQTYTEALPGQSAYPATVTIARAATGLPLPAPPAGEMAEVRDRGLVVLSWASKAIDAQAHREQQTRALPLVLARHVAPHLGREVTAAAVLPAPATTATAAATAPGPASYTATSSPGTTAATTTATPGAPGVLRRGDRGEDVRALQELLTAAGWPTVADGLFGPDTEAKVRAFQGERGLSRDGVAGPATMEALRVQGGHGPPPFVQARNYHRGRLRPVRAVVLHTMEAAETLRTAENVAAWFAGPSAPRASAHFCVDGDSIVQCVAEEDTAWAAPGLNADGIQIELAGYAAQTPGQWGDPYSRAMLALAAPLVAALCRRHGLPVAFIDAVGLLRGDRGITTHAEVTRAYRESAHTDPGASFPMAAFLEAVRAS